LGVPFSELDNVCETVRVGGVVGVADNITGIEFGGVFEDGGFELAEFF